MAEDSLPTRDSAHTTPSTIGAATGPDPNRSNTSPVGPFGIPRRWWIACLVVAGVSGLIATAAAAQMASNGDLTQVDALTVLDESVEADGPEPVVDDPESLGATLPETPLVGLDGETASFADFRGTPLLINFWAASCPPCLAEMPMLQKLSEGYAGLKVIGINSGETDDTAIGMIEKTKVDYPQFVDPTQRLSTELDVLALPTTLLVTAEGEIVHVRTGALNEAAARQLIEEHLGVTE